MDKKFWNRRRFLTTSLFAATASAGVAMFHARRPFLLNPCLNPAEAMPDAPWLTPWLSRLWQGLDPEKVWDCHAHLAGVGDSEYGLQVGEKMKSLWHPILYSQRLFYINAGCVNSYNPDTDEPGTIDENYVRRLALLAENMPAGFKALLFAFDWYHDDKGNASPELSTFYVPDSYARKVAGDYPDRFEWVASIHPYRADAVERLEKAVEDGAKAVKWLPAAQNIDPASPRCDAFFAALSRLRLPLIVHCGEEKAVQSTRLIPLGNPLRLRRALDGGVRVVVAHCASEGEDDDLDHPKRRERSFILFARLMENSDWRNNLFGDISAVVLRNRHPEILKTLLTRQGWHHRILNGSDYPLPAILPLISLSRLVRHDLLAKEDADRLATLRDSNALYFDFALKRCLRWQGHAFPAPVFETRAFFEHR